jgi:hypothetical protein
MVPKWGQTFGSGAPDRLIRVTEGRWFDLSDDVRDEIRRQTDEQFDHTIEIPDGLTEDEAVASVIEQYKILTGVELPEADVRAEVREQTAGRETTDATSTP